RVVRLEVLGGRGRRLAARTVVRLRVAAEQRAGEPEPDVRDRRRRHPRGAADRERSLVVRDRLAVASGLAQDLGGVVERERAVRVILAELRLEDRKALAERLERLGVALALALQRSEVGED